MIWIHVSKIETVSIGFGYQSKKSFQINWKLYPNKMETVSILETCIQTKWKPFPFWKHVSKSNGNGFHFGNMYPNQMESFHFGNCFQITWKPLLPLWILLRGIQNGLVTAFSGEEYVVCPRHFYKRVGPFVRPSVHREKWH